MIKFVQKNLTLALFLYITLALLLTGFGFLSINTQAQERVRSFQRVNSDWRSQVIVNLKSNTNPQQVLNKIRSNDSAASRITSQSLENSTNGSDQLVINLENEADFKSLENELKAISEISSIQRNYPYKSMYTPNDPLFAGSWQLQDAGFGNKAQSAWGSVGAALGVATCTEATPLCGGREDVKIAVIDSGVQTDIAEFNNTTFANPAEFYYSGSPCTPDVTVLFLAGEYLCRDNTQNDTCPLGFEEACGHGTAVASVIAGSDNSVGTVGIAYNTTVMPIAVKYAFDSLGLSQAIKYAKENGADVINLSLGTNFNDPTVNQEIKLAKDAGVIVVASAGNCGAVVAQHSSCFGSLVRAGDPGYNVVNPIIYPAYNSDVISVGAINQNGTRSSYSTFNDQVDVVAPIGTGYPVARRDGTFGNALGTSFAAPQLAGVAGLFKSVRGATGSTTADFLSTIELNSTDLGTTGRDNQFGYGNLNTNFVVSSPEIFITSPTSSSNLIYDQNVPIQLDSNSSSFSINKVEYFVNNQKISEKSSPNLSSSWLNDKLGLNFSLKAIATGELGQRGVSNIITFNSSLLTTDWVTDSIGNTIHPYEMTEFNNKLYQFHVGLNGRIYTRETSNTEIFQNNSNKEDWSNWQTSADVSEETRLPISAAVHNGRIFHTHVGAGSQGKIFTRSSVDGRNWSTWTKSNDAAEDTKKPVYMTSFNGKLYQVHVGLSGRIFTRSSVSVNENGGISWGNWAKGNDTSEFTNLPVTMSTFNDGTNVRLYQVHIGGNKRIYTRSSLDGINWSTWVTGFDLGESTSTQVTMAANAQYLYQAHRGDSGQIFTRVSKNGTTWTGWFQNFGNTNLPITMAIYNNKVYQGHVSLTGNIWWRTIN